MEQTRCPDCTAGQIYEVCPVCDGCGFDNLEPCGACHGTGGVTSPCATCRETGHVSRAFRTLLEKDRWARRYAPEWSGDSADHPGITDFGLAHWFRARPEVPEQSVTHVKGVVNDFDDSEVWVFCTEPGKVVRLYGLSWGYGGTGPNGLATVLVDCGLFTSHLEAMRWVSSQTWGESPKGWILRREV